ncbi:porin [Herbaspirillum chlorophenolicum]|uniref:porin n=1 Tax=Herbaspirillum chlorophenolicum TaxID=211589 RepID=UPI000AE55A7F|nr:porin [Herbaspirillum chlorophenolicum]
MRNTLFLGVALPCAAFFSMPAPAAAAPVSQGVTLYGLIDVGMEYINNAGPRGGAILRMHSGGRSTSHIGMRTEEDLGGGNKAFVHLETGFHPDTGGLAVPASFFNRQANVGIEGAYGRLLVGRSESTTGDFFLNDALANNYSWSGVSTHLRGGRRDGTLGRISNLIKYQGSAGRYKFGASYGLGEVAGQVSAGAKYSAALDYRNDGFGWTLTYDRDNSDTLEPGYSRAGNVSLSGVLPIGKVKTYAGYRRHVKHGIGDRPDRRSDFVWLGLAMPLSERNALAFGYYHVDVRNAAMGLSGNPNLLAMRLTHTMSARTDLYTTLAYAWVPCGDPIGVGNSPQLYAENGRQTGLNVGMRHRF